VRCCCRGSGRGSGRGGGGARCCCRGSGRGGGGRRRRCEGGGAAGGGGRARGEGGAGPGRVQHDAQGAPGRAREEKGGRSRSASRGADAGRRESQQRRVGGAAARRTAEGGAGRARQHPRLSAAAFVAAGRPGGRARRAGAAAGHLRHAGGVAHLLCQGEGAARPPGASGLRHPLRPLPAPGDEAPTRQDPADGRGRVQGVPARHQPLPEEAVAGQPAQRARGALHAAHRTGADQAGADRQEARRLDGCAGERERAARVPLDGHRAAGDPRARHGQAEDAPPFGVLRRAETADHRLP